MAESVEVLLEQNVDAIQNLLQVFEQGQQKCEQVQLLVDRIEGELNSTSAFEQWRAVLDSLHRTEAALRTVDQELEQQFDSRGQQVNDFQEELVALTSEIDETFNVVVSTAIDCQSQLESKLEGLSAQFADWSEALQRLSEALSTAGNAAQELIDGFGSGVELAVEGLDAKKTLMADRMNDVGVQFGEQLQLLLVEFQGQAEASADSFSGFLTQFRSRAETSAVELQQKFLQECFGEITNCANELANALSAASTFVEGLEGTLGNETEDLLKQINVIVGLIEKVKPALDMIQTVLG